MSVLVKKPPHLWLALYAFAGFLLEPIFSAFTGHATLASSVSPLSRATGRKPRGHHHGGRKSTCRKSTGSGLTQRSIEASARSLVLTSERSHPSTGRGGRPQFFRNADFGSLTSGRTPPAAPTTGRTKL